MQGLGAHGARWEWKKQTWRRLLEERLASWQNLERGVRARTRMCPSCRYLAPQGEASCPSCGASMRGVPGGGWSRLAAMVLPGVGSMTVVLITANVVMAIAALGLSGGPAADAPGINPLRLLAPSGEVLYHLGSKFAGIPGYPGIYNGQVWRLITAGYLHGGLLHLLFNCYALSILGPLIEGSFGGRRLFVLYTTSGIAALSVSTLFHPYIPTVGASGSLFGLMGFAFFYGRFRGGSVGRAVADQLLRWIVFSAIMILMPGIDNLAHIGGFLCGAALAFVLDPGEPRTPVTVIGLRLFNAAAWVVTVGSFVAMIVTYREFSAAVR